MAEMVLPGTYIEVRPEGLITPARVSVGTIGIVGTAAKGPLIQTVFLGNYLEAKEVFGEYDAWEGGEAHELTLVRALEVAYAHGATTVIAVRVASGSAASASIALSSAGGPAVRLEAVSAGTWGNGLRAQVVAGAEQAFIVGAHPALSGANLELSHGPVAKSARNRIVVASGGTQQSLTILYTGAPDDDPVPSPLPAGHVVVHRTTRVLTFVAPAPAPTTVTASYAVEATGADTVVLTLGRAEERFTVVSGDHLLASLRASAWVAGSVVDDDESAARLAQTANPASFGGGANGEVAVHSDYAGGLARLENENAHIIVGAGQDVAFGDELKSHCELASTDVLRRDRIGVVGSALRASPDVLRGHNLDADRVVYVAPGIRFNDSAARTEVTLPGAYAAAAVAGMLSSYPAHVSLTNKVLSVGGLETRFTPTQLSQLVQARILALEERQGHRVVRAVTTSTNTAWEVITTRRIVDYAKFGVRSACNPYIGLLNNDRVRTNLHSTITSFLNDMLADEMLTDYKLEVTATRADEIKGTVKVTMSLQPVFSIEFIKVTMLLQ